MFVCDDDNGLIVVEVTLALSCSHSYPTPLHKHIGCLQVTLNYWGLYGINTIHSGSQTHKM
jgi:hypothetical protein